MKDIFSVDFRDAIRKVVRHELKEKFSIKAPKEKDKPTKFLENENPFQVFGVLLKRVPSKSVKEDNYFSVPVFLVDAFEYLSNHLKVEGLFRKSGSVGRQKILREIVERDGTCCSCDFVQPHDVASIVKQFFRELPDPLLTNHLSSTFLKCLTLNSTNETISAVALCCNLLPDEHLRVLKFFAEFISDVASHSVESKMTLANLSIVFAPNLMGNVGKDKNNEKMKEVTQIIELLFKNSHLIGMIPDTLFEKASQVNVEGDFNSSSGDELENDETASHRGRTMTKSDKKRDRSKSITGFLKRNFKQNERNPPHRTRSKSEKSIAVRQGSFLKVQMSTDSLSSVDGDARRNPKRATSVKHNSPIRKSPRLTKKPQISAPVIKTMSNQIVVTPRKCFHSIQPSSTGAGIILKTGQKEITEKEAKKTDRKVVLPSKFELNKTSEGVGKVNDSYKLYRSQSAYTSASIQHHTHDNTTEPKLPQSKISRSTQKPHVRKTRRASSLNRRRERYASNPSRRQLPKTPPQGLLDYSVVSSSELPELSTCNLPSIDETPPKESCSMKVPCLTTDTSRKVSLKRDTQLKSSMKLRTPLTEKNSVETQKSIPDVIVSVKKKKKQVTPYSLTPQIGTRKQHNPEYV